MLWGRWCASWPLTQSDLTVTLVKGIISSSFFQREITVIIDVFRAEFWPYILHLNFQIA